MPTQREPEAFTAKQLADVERGNLTGREKRLVATVRKLERLLLKRDEGGNAKCAELAREVTRLEGQLESLSEEKDKYRVLILADSKDSIEVYADARVGVHVGCLPEHHGEQEFTEAVEFALGTASSMFQNIVHDPTVRPEWFSTKRLSRGEFRYYLLRREEQRYLQKIDRAIRELAKPQTEESALGAPPAIDNIPF